MAAGTTPGHEPPIERLDDSDGLPQSQPRHADASERPITPAKTPGTLRFTSSADTSHDASMPHGGTSASGGGSGVNTGEQQARPLNSSAQAARSSPSSRKRSATPRRARGTSPGPTASPSGKPHSHGVDIKTRMNYDKRTLRRMYRSAFVESIREWRLSHVVPGGMPPGPHACRVFVRARPLFDAEVQQGEFDTLTIYEEWGEVLVHNCLFQSDLVRMYIQHSGFSFTRVFDSVAGNEAVYAECGSPLIAHALSGNLATLFMFGQTGSGKTFTMEGIVRLAAHDLFAVPAARGGGKNHVTMRAFEIIGKKCIDLLSDERVELKLREDEDGQTNIVGATELIARSTDEFLGTVREALQGRTVAGHGRNEESSRSHYVCMIQLPFVSGSLVLVDCAGTERRQDTDGHNPERARESADINTSLHALKECIRSWQRREQRGHRGGVNEQDEQDERSRQVRVPYRSSQLTRVLHESFTQRGSLLFAIGTVSPATMDTEHSLSTLRTLQMLQAESGSFESRSEVAPIQNARRERSLGSTATDSRGNRRL
eukprot:TRINITY_DN18818_c0_g2_i4.p1 TRINITY_DN18818_c0_g2~~TRINITY_DN18818_c0_g2_i4.p1  ORF type:complete len:568 (-),score=92.08 TRINITY_DN18818_c0_g2_i4:66-1694(-)